MMIELDLQSDKPIYIQLRHKIIEGIAQGYLVAGDSLPSVRRMAKDLGVNMHTVNKAYQILKQEGFIYIHRQKGVVIQPDGFPAATGAFYHKLREELTPLIAEALARGMSQADFMRMNEDIFTSFSHEPLDRRN